MTNKKIQANNGKLLLGDALSVDHATGRIGIGTASPPSPLHVAATAVGSVPALGAASSHFSTGNSTEYGTMIGTLGSGNGFIQQQRFDGTATAYNLLLQPNGGNVGIGTASPGADYRLTVSNSGDTSVQRIESTFAGNSLQAISLYGSNATDEFVLAHRTINNTFYISHNPTDYTGPNVEAAAKLAITSAGAVTLGPSSGLTTYHQINGTILSTVTGALTGRPYIVGGGGPVIGGGFYYGSGSERALFTGVGIASMFITPGSSSGTAVCTWKANYIDSQTAGDPLDNTNNQTIGTVTAAGAWTLGPSGGLTGTELHNVYGTSSLASPAMALRKLTGADSASNYYLTCLAGASGTTSQGGLWNNASGDFATYTVSDARVKDEIIDADYGLSQIQQLRPRKYTKRGKQNVKGFIAQEVEAVLPESVGTIIDEDTGESLKVLEMQTMIPVLVRAVQELKAELDTLKAQVEAGS